jgi:uncharacterized HhH-GPD family protein
MPESHSASTQPVCTAAALRAFAHELAVAGAAQMGGDFTDDRAADRLIKSSPEAFLFGVLFTQGIPAERAWAGPYLLRERLGHLDLRRLAVERAAVDEAVSLRPSLHRFKHTVAGWVSDAAQRVLDRYEGNAALIWPDGSTALEVGERLSAFAGIGRKKAAMATEILVRHFGVRIVGMQDGAVAYDVHVRRVFLRSGLAERDTPLDIDAAARSACPDAPGSLDLAAWLVGRQWCHPSGPVCDECRLDGACARRVWIGVEGVGARGSR